MQYQLIRYSRYAETENDRARALQQIDPWADDQPNDQEN